MPQKIHTVSLELTMKLMSDISKIDRFDASWAQTEKREGQTLKQLRAIATVRSVGASTRIEGSKMTDGEVEVLIEKLKVSKLEERDEQEVAGYFETLDTIVESYKNIEVTEGNLKNLHKILMSYSEKDEWHRGDYKQVSNAVEASQPNGDKYILFKTTEPGWPTDDAMQKLLAWYHADGDTLPIVKAALFVYEFLSIHPFQDGNGRLSRLIATLLLLRHGYSWIQYVSFEHEIENRKSEYYKVLMQTQKQRPGEQVDAWVVFFLDCLLKIQVQLNDKLTTIAHTSIQLAPREKNILAFIENHPGSKSSDIAEKLDIPLSTVKKMLTAMVESKTLIKYGVGAGTNYLAEKRSPLKKDLMFQLTNANKKKEFLLMTPGSYVELKRIILTPLFEWKSPNEWGAKLINSGLAFKITGYYSRGGSFTYPYYAIARYLDTRSFQPDFKLYQPINIPVDVSAIIPNMYDYPIRIELELFATVPAFDFEVMFVYDEV